MNELEYARKSLNFNELDNVNYGFIGGLLNKIEVSKDGNVPVQDIIEVYKIAVNYAISVKK